MTGLVLAILGLFSAAWAGEPVQLPPGESAEAWATALEMAGLEVGGADARIRIVRTDSGVWFVEAITTGDSARRIRVPTPRSRRDREEIAFLAQGVAREVAAAPTPLVQQAPPLPPPPPPPGDVRPALARPAAAVVPEHAEAAKIEALLPGQSSIDDFTERLPSSRPPSIESIEYWSSGPGVGMAPFDIRFGAAARPNNQVAGIIGLGLLLAQHKNTSLRVAWQAHAARDLNLNFNRTLTTADLELELAQRLFGRFHVGLAAAASYRTFRQQGTPIYRGVVPVLTPRVLFAPLQGSHFATDFWVDAGFDLGRFELELEDGTPIYLSPVEFGAGIRIRFRGSRDLFDGDRTSKK